MECILTILFILVIILCCVFFYRRKKAMVYVGGAIIQEYKDDFLNNKKQFQKNKHKQQLKNVLIIDVANMYVGWYMEKYKNKPIPSSQDILLSNYIECIKDHYKRFSKENNMGKCGVNYIIKNYKCNSGSKLSKEKIGKQIYQILFNLVNDNSNLFVTIAEDYGDYPISKWKNKTYHYLRGRDDYACFYMSNYYKLRHVNSFIMSDDKFDDYEKFNVVPDFTLKHLDKVKKMQTNKINSQKIKPHKINLGNIDDYKLVKITLDFKFNGDKGAVFTIPLPGSVWV